MMNIKPLKIRNKVMKPHKALRDPLIISPKRNHV